MGSGRGSLEIVRRAIRTVFFMMIMLGSLLVFSAPVFVAISDIIIPCALLSTFTCTACPSMKNDWTHYSFRSSLVDIPLISMVRSLIILCIYSLCDVPSLSHGPYLGAATICCLGSVVVLTVKACLFTVSDTMQRLPPVTRSLHLKQSWGMPVMFLSSMVLALGHIVVAYRTSCRARRKLLIHRVDPEAVLACKAVFHGYQKVPRSPIPNSGKNAKGSAEEKRRLGYEERDLPTRMLADIDSLFVPCEGLLVHYKIINGGPCLGSLTCSTFQDNHVGSQCVTPGRVRFDNVSAVYPSNGVSLPRSFSNNMTNASLYTPLLSASPMEANQVRSSGFNGRSGFSQNIPVLNLDEYGLVSSAKVSKPGRVDAKLGHYKNGFDGIILIHGFGGGVFSWRHVMSPLARQTGCAVAAFDRPGWGLTSRPLRGEWEEKRLPNPYELQSQVNLLFSFCREMGFSSVVLVGHDDGGLLALMAAERAQASRDVHQVQIKGVVLIGVSLSREVVPAFARILLHTSLGQHMLRPLLRTEISQVANRRAWYDATKLTPDVIDLYKAPLCVEGWDKALGEVSKLSSSNVLSSHNASELLKAVHDLPVLIAAGAEDILVSLKSSQVLASKLPNSRLVAVSGCGHLPHEECPEALLAALLPFVSKLFMVSSEISTSE
eukprot:Gb_19642 [translate_table: standard]